MTAPSSNAYAFALLILDLDNQCLWRRSQFIAMRPKAFALLRYLVEHPGRLVAKKELLAALWPDSHVEDAVIKTHMTEVRRAVQDDARSPMLIETMHGRGYRFVADVVALPSRALQAGDLAGVRSSGLVGREADLERLEAYREQCARGRRCFVLLSGEAGIGKTAIVTSLVRQLEVSPSQIVAVGHCVEHRDAGETYLPILEAIGGLCRGPQGSRIAATFRRFAPSWVARMPGLMPARQRAPATSGELRGSLLCEMVAVVQALTRSSVLLLVIEDLHWADACTLQLLEYLAQNPDLTRLLIIGTYRPQEALLPTDVLRIMEQRLRAHSLCEAFEIRPLATADLCAYLSSRFGQHDLPAQFVAALRAHSGGNPLFASRMLDALVDQRLIVEVGGRWRLAREKVAIGVPDSIAALIARDVERVAPFEREILEAASVCGATFNTSAIAAALECEAPPVEGVCMRWARQRRFIRVEGEEQRQNGGAALLCTFLHVVYREVVLSQLGPARRAEIQRRLAAWEGRQRRDQYSHAQNEPDADASRGSGIFHLVRSGS